MFEKFTRRQKIFLIMAPLTALVVSGLVYFLFGPVGLLLPPILMGAVIAYQLVEGRHYQLDLFTRGIDEQRAIYGQVEAIIGLDRALDPQIPFPATRGWAASPDLLREVVVHVLTTPTMLAVEASSGTSTLLIAYAMERRGSGRVIALEHDAIYAARTRQLLHLHGLSHRATVVHAPLVVQPSAQGELLWYDLSKASIDAPIDLLVVDGPPEETGALARYPALPLLHAHLAKGARVFLDDGIRPDERRIAERWAQEFAATECIYLPLEKGAWSLRF